MLYSDVRSRFEKPAVQHRAISFWALNGDLQARELKRQIDFFKTMGLGGVCLHARTGLKTPYLSRRWFELMRVCVEHARDRGMLVWLYDEDRYPSGAAGGLVTTDPWYRQKRLRMEFVEPGKAGTVCNVIAWFAIANHSEKPRHYRTLSDPADCRPDEQLVAFRTLSAPLNPWYNGFTYLDAVNPKAVRKFIDSTYEPYKQHLGRHFGKTIEAMFTDEPTYGQSMIGWWGDFIDGYKDAELLEVPWTTALPDLFEREAGYSILDRLPELYFDVGKLFSKTRHDYYKLLTRLLTQSFAAQIHQWCKRAGLQFAGHVLLEETPSSQTSVVGSAMQFYEHFDIPGIDLLTDACPDYDTAIQCASVARQTGRQWVLSETYGATGWDFPLEGHKAVGDWQAALGVNRRCLHLAFYTMLGGNKRDYPASIGFQEAWATHYKPVEDYFSRLGSVLSRGAARCPLLVIHPVESTWIRWRLGANKAADVKRMDRRLISLRNWLLWEHLGFDYGEEQLLSRLARVEGRGSKARLCVGKCAYETVLVPPMLTMRRSTLDLLRQFVDAGGTVIFAGAPAKLLDVSPNDAVIDLAKRAKQIPLTEDAVRSAVTRLASLRLQTSGDSSKILSRVRDDDGRVYVFLCNTSRKKATSNINVLLQAEGRVEEWDPLTGECFAVPSNRTASGLRWKVQLPASGSRLFIVDSSRRTTLPARAVLRDRRKVSLPKEGWKFSRRESNPLVLDFVRVRIGDSKWSDRMEVLKADRWIRERLGWKPRSYFEVQPWCQPKSLGTSHRIEIETTFDIQTLPDQSPMLAVEPCIGLRRIAINLHQLPVKKPMGYWIDPCFRTYPIQTQFLKKGLNSINLQIDYVEKSGLECMFLLSNGGVRLTKDVSALTAPTKTLHIGDVTPQGMPFYTGPILYTREIQVAPRRGESVFLLLPEWRGACVVIHLDGRQVGQMLWPPYEMRLPIEDDQPHELTIELIPGRGNTFGPLHRRGKIGAWAAPLEWETTGERWQDEYRLNPNGLMRAPQLVYRR